MKSLTLGEIPHALRTFTIREAAEALRIDEGTMRGLCKSGKIKAIRWSDRSIRVRQLDLENFLKENEVQE